MNVILGWRQPRDYTQDLDALLMSKPNNVTVEMVAMWQDHVGRILAKNSTVSGSTADTPIEVEEAEEAQLDIHTVL